jgi:hypothetical protein
MLGTRMLLSSGTKFTEWWNNTVPVSSTASLKPIDVKETNIGRIVLSNYVDAGTSMATGRILQYDKMGTLLTDKLMTNNGGYYQSKFNKIAYTPSLSNAHITTGFRYMMYGTSWYPSITKYDANFNILNQIKLTTTVSSTIAYSAISDETQAIGGLQSVIHATNIDSYNIVISGVTTDTLNVQWSIQYTIGNSIPVRVIDVIAGGTYSFILLKYGEPAYSPSKILILKINTSNGTKVSSYSYTSSSYTYLNPKSFGLNGSDLTVYYKSSNRVHAQNINVNLSTTTMCYDVDIFDPNYQDISYNRAINLPLSYIRFTASNSSGMALVHIDTNSNAITYKKQISVTGTSITGFSYGYDSYDSNTHEVIGGYGNDLFNIRLNDSIPNGTYGDLTLSDLTASFTSTGLTAQAIVVTSSTPTSTWTTDTDMIMVDSTDINSYTTPLV